MGRNKPITINETLDRVILDSSERVFYFAKKRLRSRRYAVWLVIVAASVGFALYSLFVKANVFNYYPSSCLGTWDNPQNAQGEPLLGLDAKPEEFNKDNSAFYDGGGAKQVFCGGFSSEGDETEKIFKKAILKFSWAIAVPFPSSSSGAAGGAPTQVLQQSEFESQALDLTASASIIVIPDNPASVSIPFESEDQTPEPVPDSQQAPLSSEPPLITTEQPTPVPEISVTPELMPAPTPEPAPPAPEPVIENPPQPEPPPPAPAEPAPETPVSWLGRFMLASIFSDIASDSILPSIEPSSSPEISVSNSPSPSFVPVLTSPSPLSTSQVDNLTASVSQPASASYSLDDFLEVFYTTDGQNWQSLGRVNKDNFEGLKFEIPINSWDELKDLQVSVTGVFTTDAGQKVYFDGMRIEAEYGEFGENLEDIPSGSPTPSSPITEIINKIRKINLESQFLIRQKDNKKDFRADEEPTFEIETNFSPPASSSPEIKLPFAPIEAEQPGLPAGELEPPAGTASPSSFLRRSRIISLVRWLGRALAPPLAKAELDGQNLRPEGQVIAEVFDLKGSKTDIQPIKEIRAGKTTVRLPKSRSFKPGRYWLRVEVIKNNTIYMTVQDFTWGVLAVNTDKSIYLPGETANLAMAVLDEVGRMVCDARVNLNITDPSGQTNHLSTSNGTIKVNPECKRKEITVKPDYEAKYAVPFAGRYYMRLEAKTANGVWTINDYFDSRPAVAFDVRRITATRIFPANAYEVVFSVKANENYRGKVLERIPSVFEAFSISDGGSSDERGNEKVISWDVDFQKGKSYELSYSYKAPEISPQFYLLGPLKIGQFEETRQWQIAVDVTEHLILFEDFANATPTGWTCISCGGGGDGDLFANVFPVGSSSYGGAGAALGSETHTPTATTTIAVTTSARADAGTGTTNNSLTHTHATITTTFGNASNRPSYRGLKMIRRDSTGIPATLPQYAIAMFDTVTIPTGFGSYTSEDNYYIIASGSAGTGGTNGTHTHTVLTALTGTVTGTIKKGGTGAGLAASLTHTHAASSSYSYTDAKKVQPQHAGLILRAVTTDGADTPDGMIAMFDATPETSGWSVISGSTNVLENDFIMASTSYNAAGVGSNTHTHSVTAFNTSADAETGTQGLAGAGNSAAKGHKHQASFSSFSTDTNRPPYKGIIIAKCTAPCTTAVATLTLTIDAGETLNFGTVQPGPSNRVNTTPCTNKCTTRLKVDVDFGGYTISVGRKRVNPATTLASSADTSINVADTTGGINVFDGLGASCIDGTGPAVWVDGASTGLGFTLWAADIDKETACWGSGSSQTDALNTYAALPASVGAPVFLSTTTNSPNPSYASVGWSLSVTTDQRATDYTGQVIFSATTNP